MTTASTRLAALRALLADAHACSRAHPGGAPDAAVGALDARFVDLHAGWVADARAGDAVPLDDVAAELARVRALAGELAEGEDVLHSERVRIVGGMYKFVLGAPPPVPPERRSAVLEAAAWVRRIHGDLAYELAYRARTHDCDCSAAASLGRGPKATLEKLGPWSDGFHLGDEMRCPVCATRWFRGDSADDRGGWFYEVISG